MLPAAARLRHRDDFQAVFRRGRRAARGPLVLHALTGTAGSPRVGFVLGKPVGTAVVRNRIRRRLRHLLRARLGSLPAGLDLVVRVQPGAAALDQAQLAAALDAALDRLVPGPDVRDVR